VTIDVPQTREQVYDFLDAMASHERFTDHVLRDWTYDGPATGIGARATVNAVAGGRTDVVELVVVSAERPSWIREQNTGAGGNRVANGTYYLEELPSNQTRIVFEYSWQRAPLSERLTAPLVRRIMRGQYRIALKRLADELRDLEAEPGSSDRSEVTRV
jgi:hypothetical protein